MINMKLSLNVGDKVYNRGGKNIWTIIKTDIGSEVTSWQGRWFKLQNEKGDKHTHAYASDLTLILEIEKSEDFNIAILEKQYA
jgi:hypothetical protein